MADSSRKIARKHLGSLLKTALEGTGKEAEKVYDHVPAKFTASPVVCVGSYYTAAGGRGMGASGVAKAVFRLAIMLFVAVAEGTNYTAADAEDKLDDLEAGARGVVRANPAASGKWDIMRFAGQKTNTDPSLPTRIVPVKVGGLPYNMETIYVDVEVYDA
jgi:hypothetical protein